MYDKRLLLTKIQINDLSKKYIYKLDELPLYKIDERRILISDCIKETQKLIEENITSLVEGNSNEKLDWICGQILKDKLNNYI